MIMWYEVALFDCENDEDWEDGGQLLEAPNVHIRVIKGRHITLED